VLFVAGRFQRMAGVTAVTVVNFAKKLGYESFSDLKKDFQS
jgi:DNA-binding MurR/RpiR family transcriptional regulator